MPKKKLLDVIDLKNIMISKTVDEVLVNKVFPFFIISIIVNSRFSDTPREGSLNRIRGRVSLN
jgi:hypothetical protein